MSSSPLSTKTKTGRPRPVVTRSSSSTTTTSADSREKHQDALKNNIRKSNRNPAKEHGPGDDYYGSRYGPDPLTPLYVSDPVTRVERVNYVSPGIWKPGTIAAAILITVIVIIVISIMFWLLTAASVGFASGTAAGLIAGVIFFVLLIAIIIYLIWSSRRVRTF